MQLAAQAQGQKLVWDWGDAERGHWGFPLWEIFKEVTFRGWFEGMIFTPFLPAEPPFISTESLRARGVLLREGGLCAGDV